MQITFQALTYPLPAVYRETLISLGNDCIRLRKIFEANRDRTIKNAMLKAQSDLNQYDMKLRKEIGIEVTREEFKLVQPEAAK